MEKDYTHHITVKTQRTLKLVKAVLAPFSHYDRHTVTKDKQTSQSNKVVTVELTRRCGQHSWTSGRILA